MSLFLVGFSFVSLSRGAIIIYAFYLLYSLLALLIRCIRTKRAPRALIFCLLPLILFSPYLINYLLNLDIFSAALFFVQNKSSASGRLVQLADLWAFKSDFLLLGKGFLFPYFNNVTSGIGQSTWFEILLSTGLISLVGYFHFIFIMVFRPFRTIQYKSFVVVIISFILLLGMSIHYLDKIPRMMLAYSIIFGILSSYLKPRSSNPSSL